MFSAIRRRLHLSPATAIASLALVFAMTGGAFAAGKFLITSTKQIKPSVLAQLKGKAGPAGPEGKAGAGGPAGPAGLQGPAGKDGTNGQAGVNGKDGTNGESAKVEAAAATECNKEGGVKVSNASGSGTACNGKTGYTATLPVGKSETGIWAAKASGESAEQKIVQETVSFNIPLPTALEENGETEGPHLVTAAEEKDPATIPKGCDEGSVAEPRAAPGNLCFYGVTQDIGELYFFNPELGEANFGVGKIGTVLFFNFSSGSGVARGDWIVTAK